MWETRNTHVSVSKDMSHDEGYIRIVVDKTSCWLDPNRYGNQSSGEFVFSHADSVLAGSASFLLGVLGFSFNAITILALLNHRRTRTQITTPFIISLAFSDTLFSCLILPQLSIRFFARWISFIVKFNSDGLWSSFHFLGNGFWETLMTFPAGFSPFCSTVWLQ